MNKLLLFLLLFSCGKESERVLYSKYDSIYSQLQTYAQQKCVDDAEFFTYFDTYSEFDNVPFAVNDIFKIVQDSNTGLEIYVKVTQINANDIQLTFNSSDDTLDKIITYEEADHNDLGTFLKAAVCNPAYDNYFSGISGKSGKSLSFTWLRTTISVSDSDDDDDIADKYDKKKDALTVNLNYPSLLYFYNGTKEHLYDHDPDDDENDEQTVTSKITITEVTDADECDPDEDSFDTDCDFSATSSFPTCGVTIDDEAYELTGYTEKEITFDNTSCTLMKSAGGI